MSAPLSIEQFVELNKYIQENHSPFSKNELGYRRVKYVDFTIDYRTNDIFSIHIRGWGRDKLFTITNEQRDNPKSLGQRVVDYLQGKEDHFDKDEA